jgi:hypothetical protein
LYFLTPILVHLLSPRQTGVTFINKESTIVRQRLTWRKRAVARHGAAAGCHRSVEFGLSEAELPAHAVGGDLSPTDTVVERIDRRKAEVAGRVFRIQQRTQTVYGDDIHPRALGDFIQRRLSALQQERVDFDPAEAEAAAEPMPRENAATFQLAHRALGR